MKRLILTAGVLACAASVFAQGTVTFNNNITGVYRTRVYSGTVVKYGNGTADNPAGVTDWTGFAALSGTGWGAVLLGATGAGTPELGTTVTPTVFRTGLAAGSWTGVTATLSTVAPDAASATLQVFVWDRVAGGTDAAVALANYRAAMQAGRGAADFWAGLSQPFVVTQIGGSVNTPPNITTMLSFSIVPEPSSMALAGLAAASLLIFRRRK